MQLTNRLNLPASIVAAVANDPYKGGGDISVTKLITAPYQRKLLRENAEHIVEDVADRIWSLMGQIGHAIVERVTLDELTSIAEERLYHYVTVPSGDEMQKVIVSGQFDLIENRILTDFKFTSVYSRDGKIEWEQQLNLLRVLCHHRFLQTGDERYNVQGLQIIAVYRDWQKSKVGIGDYPASQVDVIPIRMWSLEGAERFLFDRVAAHMADNPPPCTDEERWATEEVYALMKDGRKSAVKLYADKAGADAACALKGKGHTVVHRPRQFRRCESYCSAAPFCPMWQEHIKQVPF